MPPIIDRETDSLYRAAQLGRDPVTGRSLAILEALANGATYRPGSLDAMLEGSADCLAELETDLWRVVLEAEPGQW